jgi:hypothetical protein
VSVDRVRPRSAKREVKCVRIVQAKSRVASCRSVEIRDYRTPRAKAKAGTWKRALKSLRGSRIHRTKLSKRGEFPRRYASRGPRVAGALQ